MVLGPINRHTGTQTTYDSTQRYSHANINRINFTFVHTHVYKSCSAYNISVWWKPINLLKPNYSYTNRVNNETTQAFQGLHNTFCVSCCCCCLFCLFFRFTVGLMVHCIETSWNYLMQTIQENTRRHTHTYTTCMKPREEKEKS